MWESWSPKKLPYDHKRAWGDGNGHLTCGPRSRVLFNRAFDGWKLLLGTWQQIVLVDFDTGAAERVYLQLVGE
jgi:thiamine phosphate synthase YjbQ (UPF0047 family)